MPRSDEARGADEGEVFHVWGTWGSRKSEIGSRKGSGGSLHSGNSAFRLQLQPSFCLFYQINDNSSYLGSLIAYFSLETTFSWGGFRNSIAPHGEGIYQVFLFPHPSSMLPPSPFRLPPSTFHLPTSTFRLPPSTFHLPTSDFRLPKTASPLISRRGLIVRCMRDGK